jgi:hypothetical protein
MSLLCCRIESVPALLPMARPAVGIGGEMDVPWLFTNLASDDLTLPHGHDKVLGRPPEM